MAHKLALKIEDIIENVSVIAVSDISAYDSNYTVTTPVLQVLVPGATAYKSLTFVKNAKLTAFNSYSLGIANIVQSLLDGLYIFNYSVEPYVITSTTIYHFRISHLLSLYLEQMSNCFDCENDEKYCKLVQGYLILQCVQYQAEKGDHCKASEFYNRAKGIIQKICL